MKRLLAVTIFAVAAAVSACSDNPVTAPSAEATQFRARFAATIASGTTICSDASTGTLVTPGGLPWAAPVSLNGSMSAWVNKNATDNVLRVRLGVDAYTSTFTVPANATNIAISGRVLGDNDIVINAGTANQQIFTTFPAVPNPYVYPSNVADSRTIPNYSTGGGLAFSASGIFSASMANTITFRVYNDDAPEPDNINNPSALSFCYTVTYTLPQVTDNYWCSPGYWKNADDAAWNTPGIGGIGTRSRLYTAVVGPITRSNKGVKDGVTTSPTIFYVIQNPNYYGGSSANAAADYLAGLAGWGGTEASGGTCPLNNAGRFVGL